MKKRLLVFPAILLAAGASAQPVLNMANNGYVVGDVYNLYTSDLSAPGADGSGTTWDFSANSMSSTPAVNNIISPSAASGSEMFPDATVALKSPDGPYAFYKVSSAGITFLGAKVDATSYIKYTDPEDLMRYPMTVGTAYTDAFAADVSISGTTIDRAGSSTVTGTGYGTLITPGGTYSNALKVKLAQDYSDLIMGTTVTYKMEVYQWHVPGYHYPLAAISKVILPSAASTGTFITSTPTSAGEIVGMEDIISFYPNPATDYIQVKNTGKNVLDRLFITDIAGKVLLDFNGNIPAQVDVTTLPAANYIINVVTKDGLRAGELITKK